MKIQTERKNGEILTSNWILEPDTAESCSIMLTSPESEILSMVLPISKKAFLKCMKTYMAGAVLNASFSKDLIRPEVDFLKDGTRSTRGFRECLRECNEVARLAKDELPGNWGYHPLHDYDDNEGTVSVSLRGNYGQRIIFSPKNYKAISKKTRYIFIFYSGQRNEMRVIKYGKTLKNARLEALKDAASDIARILQNTKHDVEYIDGQTKEHTEFVEK